MIKSIMEEIKPGDGDDFQWKFIKHGEIRGIRIAVRFSKIWNGDRYCFLEYPDFWEKPHGWSRASTKDVRLFSLVHYGDDVELFGKMDDIFEKVIKKLTQKKLLERLLFDVYVHGAHCYFESFYAYRDSLPKLREFYLGYNKRWETPWKVYQKFQENTNKYV